MMMTRQSMLKVGQKIVPNIAKSVSSNLEYKLFFDGCSKGNPGLSGAGAVIYKNNNEIWSGTSFVDTQATNNQAEYAGLILGLQKACEMNIKSLLVKGDSQLVIYQMTGKYKCNSPNLLDLFVTAKNLEQNFEIIEYNHVLRNLHP